MTTRQESESVISVLCQQFPKTFSMRGRDRRPLAFGIIEDIKRQRNPEIEFDRLDDALDWYMSHLGYKLNCCVAGSPRLDLEGNIVAKVTEAESRQAKVAVSQIHDVMKDRKRAASDGIMVVPKPVRPVVTETEAPASNGHAQPEPSVATIECRRCHETKTVDHFSPKQAEGKWPQCRKCISEINKDQAQKKAAKIGEPAQSPKVSAPVNPKVEVLAKRLDVLKQTLALATEAIVGIENELNNL